MPIMPAKAENKMLNKPLNKKMKKQPNDAINKLLSNPYPLLLLLIVLCSIFLRVAYLDKESLWLDESVTVSQANTDLGHTLYLVKHDSHFPLYVLLEHFWIKVFGVTESAVRSLSVIFGLLGVVMIYLLGKKLLNKEAGIIAAAFLAFSSTAVYYSQEARLYTLLMFLTMASLYCYFNVLENSSFKNLALYVIATTLLAYCHMFSFLIISAQAIHFAFIRKKRGKDLARGFMAFLSVGILFLPWLPVMINQMLYSTLVSWIPKPSFDSISSMMLLFFGDALIAALFLVLLFMTIALIMIGVLLHKELRGFYDMSFFALFPIITLFALSFFKPVFYPKFMLYVMPLFLLAFAWMLLALVKNNILRMLAIAFVICLSLLATFAQYNSIDKQDWRGIAQYVKSSRGEDEAVFLDPYYNAAPFAYYFDLECHKERFDFYAAFCLYERHDVLSLSIGARCCEDSSRTTSSDELETLGTFLDKPIWLIADKGTITGSNENLYSYFLARKKIVSTKDFAGNLEVVKFE